MEYLKENLLAGLKRCRDLDRIPETIGIDTWGVDFVLLDENKEILGDAVAYRDKRTTSMDEHLPITEEELYARTGIQKQIFNTLYQLEAVKRETPEVLAKARHFLMIPDYLHFFLTGELANEYTLATTTGLVNAESRKWDLELIEKLGFPTEIFLPLKMPGTSLGQFRDEIRKQLTFTSEVLLAATHDTAAAFLAVPAEDDNAVFISSGTWSLLGVELEEPLTDEASRRLGFTNEGGYEARYRYLKNIMGLWMIQSIRRELNGVSYIAEKEAPSWELEGTAKHDNWTFQDLIEEAKKAETNKRIDVNDQAFLAPESMIAEIIKQQDPQDLPELMAIVYHSLAEDYARTIRQLEERLKRTFDRIHIVGGGSQDTYLNELTAAKTGLEVVTGPVEASSLGNLMVQFLAKGEFSDRNEARRAVKKEDDNV